MIKQSSTKKRMWSNQGKLHRAKPADNTIKFGCPDCTKSRNELVAKRIKDDTTKPIFRRNAKGKRYRAHYWELCKEHKRCIRFQHLSHQPLEQDEKILENFQPPTVIDENELTTETNRWLYQQDLLQCPDPLGKYVQPMVQHFRQLTTPKQSALIVEMLSKYKTPRPKRGASFKCPKGHPGLTP